MALTGGINPFASIPLPAPQYAVNSETVTFHTSASEFSSTKRSIWLRIDDSLDGNPGPTLGAVTGTVKVGNRMVQRSVSTIALPDNEELIKVGLGTYSLQLGPIPLSSAGASVVFALAGDANGSFGVDGASLATIRSLIGQHAGSATYRVAADVNDDGVINAADLRLARMNLGMSTSIRPLQVSVATTITPVAAQRVDRTVTITSAPGVQILATDVSDDSSGGEVTGTTTTNGTFSFDTNRLTESYDEFNLNIKAQDSFGQYVNTTPTIRNAIGEAYGELFANEPPYDPELKPNDPTENLPADVDLSDEYDIQIYNQGTYGSCVANALALDYLVIEQKAEMADPISPSRLFLYYNARAALPVRPVEDSGTYIGAGIASMVDTGVAPESTWNYSQPVYAVPSLAAYDAAIDHKVTAYDQLNNTNLQQIEASLAAGYPVVLAVKTYAGFNTDETEQTGQIPMPSPGQKSEGGHAIMLVGYDNATQEFKFANSWGDHWGHDGYGFLPYAYVTADGSGLYSIRQES